MHDPARPNVIWIFGDQHRSQAMSCMGDPNVSTPAMDRMSTDGLHFRQAMANNPWCCPFRYSLLTGKYSHTGVYRTPMPMETNQALISDALNDAGYYTQYVGKWHLDGRNEGNGPKKVLRERRGRFDCWIGYENNNSQYDTYVHGHTANGDEVDLYRLPTYETDALTDIFIEQMRTHVKGQPTGEKQGDAQPFFGVLSVQPPHTPGIAPYEDMARHRPGTIQLRPNVPPVDWVTENSRKRLAGYYAQIENLDQNLHRLRTELKTLGIEDNTVVMFFSDHGDCMGSHGYQDKSSFWEESVRIPFLWSTGAPYKGQKCGFIDAMITGVDIAPTTLGMCGVEVPDEMQGFDYSDYRFNANKGPLDGEPDSAYIQHVVRKLHTDTFDRAWRGVVTKDGWKYVCIPGAPCAMFNLNDDPYEMCNLAFNQRFKAERAVLHDRLGAWVTDTGDEFELPDL